MKASLSSIWIIIIMLNSNLIFAQNLIKNSSFEDTIPCFTYPGPPQLPCNFWFWATGGSSDYFYLASSGCFTGAPQNVFGFQYPRSGNAFVGLYNWKIQPFINRREYIEGILIDTLKQNHTYCVSFYVSAANNCKYLSDDIGAYFSNDSIADYTNGFVLPYAPQIENTQGNILSDTVNWMLVSGSFVAQGGEKYITIGNFKNDSNTSLVLLPGAIYDLSYYYIDDVSVVDCTVGITEVNGINFTIIPNPVTEKLLISIENYKPMTSSLIISDITGQVVLRNCFTPLQKPNEIDVSGLSGGIYFITLKTTNGSWVKKFIKQ